MTRDFEIHVYFEHRPLTAELVDALLAGLAAAGLDLGAPEPDAYPALAGFAATDSGAGRAAAQDLETLLRSKEPPVGAGYGILPLRTPPSGDAGAQAFLTFSRPDPSTGLDGVSLVVDGAAFLRDEPAALDAAFEWFAVLCCRLDVLYGWADWETATFLVAAPSRRDVRAGALPRLLRFNAVGPGLAAAVDLPAIESSARRYRRLANGVVLFEAGHEG
jgi:hypothetical protein